MNLQQARSNIIALEKISLEMKQVECPLGHMFADGMYARKIFVPAGTTVVTKIHNQKHFTFVMKGKCIVYADGKTYTVEAPQVFITEPGTKRAVYVLEDTIWVTVHHNPNNETNLEEIEKFVIAKDFGSIRGPDSKEELPWLG